jgi:hypothetical protein
VLLFFAAGRQIIMAETLIFEPATETYEGFSLLQHKHISVTTAAMAAARQIGVQRAETNIHFFAQILSLDFWLRDPILLALPGVIVTDIPPV